ncbi:MAG: branched-chain amino acid transport system substrate-binding protein [Sulfurospirillum sp.]|jgi:branched-chain amino acid transport system substrate-binding protein|nr:branched-chain amino acid transport system substrate-binding protein [Sulfurospirillum sp.]DAB31549.1 MAG TPA: branched chain amino acid ABC transporter substrate-binding protein [Sulfurospirillum sp. UBA11407]
MKKMLPKIAASVALCSALVTASSAADVIKIGVQAPITGKYANEGQSIDNGVRLVVDQVNAKGGVLGKKIEVVSCDDEGTAQKAAICARKLVNEGVMAVIGSYTSGATEAAQTTYYRSGVLQTSDGTSDSLTKHKYWTFFRNSFQNSAQADFTAKYLVKEKGYKRIAVLSDYSSYAVGLADSVVASIKAESGNTIYQGKIKSGTQNFTAVLTKIKSMDPDAIYFSGYYTDGGLLRAQQIQLGIKADFIGGDSNDNPDFMKLAGASAKGTLLVNFPTPDFLPYDTAKQFLKDYNDKYGMAPASVWALMNIDGLKAILYAAEQTKSLDTKTISDYLHTLKDFPGITGPVSFREDGERINTKFNVYEVQADNSYKIINN